VRAFVPGPQLPHGVNVIRTFDTCQLEDFRLTVGEFDRGEVRLASRLPMLANLRLM
jgi:hypothetical protein